MSLCGSRPCINSENFKYVSPVITILYLLHLGFVLVIIYIWGLIMQFLIIPTGSMCVYCLCVDPNYQLTKPAIVDVL